MKSLINESKAILDVWQWKEQIYNEVKDLPIEKMILAISEKAKENSEKIMKSRHLTKSST